MRSKRIQKIPQNLEDFVHSINNTKDKNKANGSIKKTDKNGSQNVSEGKSRKTVGKKNKGRSIESSNDREGKAEIEEMNRNDGFDGDLNGDQFPPIIDQVGSNGNDGDQVCLDQDSGDNGKEKDDGVKSNDVSKGSTNKPDREKRNRNRMALEKAKPSKLPIWVKIINVPIEAWSVKGISALASSLGKPIIMDDMTARICAKGEGKENKNYNKWNGYSEVYNRQMYYGTQNKYYSGREKNGKWDYMRKQYDVMRNPSGENNSRGNNKGGNNKIHKVNMENTKEKNTVINSSEKENLEKVSNKANEMETSTYNRFTLLNELVGENELILPIEQRKVVDE
nr:zinc knuckle CX2CX4HX4C [Tanacetum cinerariifolium]